MDIDGPILIGNSTAFATIATKRHICAKPKNVHRQYGYTLRLLNAGLSKSIATVVRLITPLIVTTNGQPHWASRTRTLVSIDSTRNMRRGLLMVAGFLLIYSWRVAQATDCIVAVSNEHMNAMCPAHIPRAMF